MRVSLAAASLALLLAQTPALANPRVGRHDVPTLFAIGKNTDRNQVQYGIRLDDHCMPIGSAPVYAYWRQFEKGPEVLEDLNFLDRIAYGIADQRANGDAAAPRIVLRLRAAAHRLIAVYPYRDGDRCAAHSMTIIAGGPAQLHEIHVQLSGPISVAWVDLVGTRDDGSPAVERVKP
jgi:Domain of unknown function (DUF4833)